MFTCYCLLYATLSISLFVYFLLFFITVEFCIIFVFHLHTLETENYNDVVFIQTLCVCFDICKF